MNDSSSDVRERVIVSCPDCQEKYAVTASRIPPQGGRLTCRICGGRIVLQGRRAALGAPVVAKEPDAPHENASLANAQGDSRESTVECPHCGKSFTPAAASAPEPEIAAVHLAAAASLAGATPLSSDSPPRQKTILVAEDTEFFLQLVKETLGDQYRMLGARTKAEALRLLGRESIDLVILDLSLESPEDGLEVLAGAAPRGLPCLIFTARNEVDLWGDGWVRLQAQGATDLLLKGMNIEEQLLSKVAALIGGN